MKSGWLLKRLNEILITVVWWLLRQRQMRAKGGLEKAICSQANSHVRKVEKTEPISRRRSWAKTKKSACRLCRFRGSLAPCGAKEVVKSCWVYVTRSVELSDFPSWMFPVGEICCPPVGPPVGTCRWWQQWWNGSSPGCFFSVMTGLQGSENIWEISRYGCWTKNNGTVPPNHPCVHRVFHEIHHPFWGFSYHYFWKHPYWAKVLPTRVSKLLEQWWEPWLFAVYKGLNYPAILGITIIIRIPINQLV